MKKFQEQKNRKKILYLLISFIFFLMIEIIVYQSYALYEQQNTYDVIEGKVPAFMNDYDVKIAVLVDGVTTKQIPSKDSGKVIEQIICDHGGIGAWDYQNWTLVIKNMTEKRTKCQLTFQTKYSESILNGADPVVKDGLVPVIIQSDGTVQKANITKEWYRYESKNWANAVILFDESIVYGDGEVIPEDNIESYFVWIPRYRYQIFNIDPYSGDLETIELSNYQNKAKEISLVFETKDRKKSDDTGIGGWLTHPAFTTFDTNGMWVGKFETGYKGANTTVEAQKNEFDVSKMVIKPNLYSWRSINIANAFQNSYHYKRKLESHMMKNTEWGAVAYLSHSKYGILNKIRMNNHSDYKTGYAAVKEPTCGYTEDNRECNRYGNSEDITQLYNTNIGYLASTTGNISGIYDMSGGADEYMMSVMKDKNGGFTSGRDYSANSGFNGTFGCPDCDSDHAEVTELTDGIPFPDNQYYDLYDFNNTWLNFNRTKMGDATRELGPFFHIYYVAEKRQTIGSWYQGVSGAIFHVHSWFRRGGDMRTGIQSDIFAFSNESGGPLWLGSYRVVLHV